MVAGNPETTVNFRPLASFRALYCLQGRNKPAPKGKPAKKMYVLPFRGETKYYPLHAHAEYVPLRAVPLDGLSSC